MNTMCHFLLGLGLLLLPMRGAAQIQIQISIKVILDANGNPPVNQPDRVQQAVATANRLLLATGRGYQLAADEILLVPGISQYFRTTISEGGRNNLEADAQNETIRYRWRSGVINVYVNDSTNGAAGICSFPGDHQTILLGRRSGEVTLLHELGHFFSLYHTQGRSCGDCDSCGGVFDDTSDHVSDTLRDWDCWDRDDIARNNNLGNSYAVLNATDRERVDNVFFNVMSYHDDRERLTPGQLDRWTDSANGSRRWAVTGGTRFVDYRNEAQSPDGSSEANVIFGAPAFVGGPYPTVARGILAAASSDIVLIRAGTYAEQLTLDRPATLRASRGDVTLR